MTFLEHEDNVKYLVVDIGEGTTDVSLIQKKDQSFVIVGERGHLGKGGIDFTIGKSIMNKQ